MKNTIKIGQVCNISEDQGGGRGKVIAIGIWNDEDIAILDMTDNKGGNPDMEIYTISYLELLLNEKHYD